MRKLNWSQAIQSTGIRLNHLAAKLGWSRQYMSKALRKDNIDNRENIILALEVAHDKQRDVIKQLRKDLRFRKREYGSRK